MSNLKNFRFLCSKCGKFFSTKHRLKEHAAQHTGEKNHACNECDKKFSSESRLRCHRRTHVKLIYFFLNHNNYFYFDLLQERS